MPKKRTNAIKRFTPYTGHRARRAIAAGLLITMAFFAAGCEKAGSFFTGDSTPHLVSKTSADISVAIAAYQTLNPILSKDEDIYYLEKLVYDGLVRLDKEYLAQPALASSWTFGDGGESLTFQLKSGVMWHDGKKLTAEDVKFTIDAMLRVKGTEQSLQAQYVSNIKSVKENGSDQVTVYFNEPQLTGAENFTFPIIPRHQFRSVNDVFNQKDGFMPVGTGPYKVSGATGVREIKLVPNEAYHEGTVAQNSMSFKCMPDKISAVELFRIYDINCMIAKDTDRAVLFAGKDLKVVDYPSGEMEVLGFNFTNPILAEEKVRKAIAHVLDISEIIQTAYMGNGVASTNVYPVHFYGENPPEALQVYDIEAGDNLLEEAGYFDTNKDFKRDDIDGNAITLKIITNVDDEPRKIVAEMLKAGLEKLNISASITLLDWASYTSAIRSGNYDLFIGGYSLSDKIDLRFLLDSGSGNPARYKNPNMDDYLSSIKYKQTSDEKKQSFAAMKNLLNQQTPYYCLLYKTYSMALTSTMQGNLDVLWFDPYRGCIDWKYTYSLPPEGEEETS